MPERLPISVLVLARDAAADLDVLLRTLGFASDVVVVVDAASDAATRAIAEQHAARVFVRALDGFGAQRRFALEQCREDWVLWIDTDERLDSGAEATLRAAIASGASDGYRLGRDGWFLGKRIRFCGWRGERVLRFFRRARARFDDAAVHEQVRVEGTTSDLPLTLAHHSYATWADCRDKLFRYAKAGALDARRRGKRATALDVVLRPPLRFLRMYVLQAGFIDGAHGAVLCALASAQVYLKYAELWAASRVPEPEPERAAAAHEAESVRTAARAHAPAGGEPESSRAASADPRP